MVSREPIEGEEPQASEPAGARAGETSESPRGSIWRSARRGVQRFVHQRPAVVRLGENASWLIGERLAVLAINFFVNTWFIRYLGPDRYGLYSYAVSVAAIFAALSTLGMESLLVRDIARDSSKSGAILGSALVARLAVGLAAWSGCVASVWLLRSDHDSRILVLVMGLNAVFIAAGVFESWFQATLNADKLVMTRLAVTVAAQAVRVGLIIAHASLLTFGVLFVVTTAATVGATYYAYRSRTSALESLTWDATTAKQLVRDSWPMALTAIGIGIYMKVDQLMLVAIRGETENGLYAPAATLSELWYFLPLAISASAFPVIVKVLDTMSKREAEVRLQSFYDAMAAMSYGIVVPTVILADPIVRALYGPDYRPTASILRVHILSLLFVSLGVARGRYLLAKNMTTFLLLATTFGAVSNIALNLVLIPRWGALGAAWATVFSYGVANYASGLFSPSVRPQTLLLTRALAIPIRGPLLIWRSMCSRLRSH